MARINVLREKQTPHGTIQLATVDPDDFPFDDNLTLLFNVPGQVSYNHHLGFITTGDKNGAEMLFMAIAAFAGCPNPRS